MYIVYSHINGELDKFYGFFKTECEAIYFIDNFLHTPTVDVSYEFVPFIKISYLESE